MQQFLEAIREAIEHKNRYGALALALALPDVCGNVDKPNRKTSERYMDWTERWLSPKFVGPRGTVFLETSDIYQFRCALLHEGVATLPPKKRVALDQIIFADGPHLNLMTNNFVNGKRLPDTLQLDPLRFAAEVCEAVEDWLLAVKDDPLIQQRLGELLLIQPTATLGGNAIRFG